MTNEILAEYRDLLETVEEDNNKTIDEMAKELDVLLSNDNAYTNFFLPSFNRFV